MTVTENTHAVRIRHGTLTDEAQINVPPQRAGGLWKVITWAVRCPRCNSPHSKALTGKRTNGQGMNEHYRRCANCQLRFRVISE